MLNRRTVLCMGGALLAQQLAWAAPQKRICTAPPVTTTADIFIVVVDRTAPRNEQLRNSIVRTVEKAIKPGQRLVLWSFGGQSDASLPTLIADETLPKIPTQSNNTLPGLVKTLMQTDGEADAIRLCAESYITNRLTDFVQKLTTEINDEDDDQNGTSPILIAINNALAPFASTQNALIRVLVVSDGREHSQAISFYAKKDQPAPSTASLIQLAKAAYPAMWARARISFAGIGRSTLGDPSLIEDMRVVWTAIIKSRSAQVGELSPSTVQNF